MDISNALMDFGALGIFCAFLVYQHLQMQKRLDKLSAEWVSSLQKVESEHREAEEHIRDRYDKVVARYSETRESIYKEVVSTLTDNQQLLVSLESKIEDLRKARLGLGNDNNQAQ